MSLNSLNNHIFVTLEFPDTFFCHFYMKLISVSRKLIYALVKKIYYTEKMRNTKQSIQVLFKIFVITHFLAITFLCIKKYFAKQKV